MITQNKFPQKKSMELALIDDKSIVDVEAGGVGEASIRRKPMKEERLYVAVGKEVRENESIVLWAIQNCGGCPLSIIHVHHPADFIPILGKKHYWSSLEEQQVMKYRGIERQLMLKTLDEYLHICRQFGVEAEKQYVEMDSIEHGILQLINRHNIEKLVIGAAADDSYHAKMIEPKSKKAVYLFLNAPASCQMWFICKGNLIQQREGVKQSVLLLEQKSSNASDTNQPGAGSLSQDLISTLRYSDFDEYEDSVGEFDRSSRVSFPQSPVHSVGSPEAESVFSSPGVSDEAKERGRELVALPESQDNKLESSPPTLLESSLNDHVYDQLEHAKIEAENAREEASEKSVRLRKAEEVALEAIGKAKMSERLYFDQLRLREATEEELTKGKEELENTRNLLRKVSHELHETVGQKLTLESLIEESNLSVKELEEKFFSAIDLLQKYRNKLDESQIELENALGEAEKLRKEICQGPSGSHIPTFISEFSNSELENATNFFDPSLKIGEGGYGSIYKGLLRHSEVAIKILNPNSVQGPREFYQENRVLYEYLSGGSLEDRLFCKDDAPPLPWQTRIRIATELCSALIFLHSSQPSCIIHGDLKPGNVLLDDNFVCKLSDFGICRVVSHGETSTEQKTLFVFTQPKGTFLYMDPEFLSTGELTPKSDVYSFGIILLCLLTGKSPLGISKEVKHALANGTLGSILDPSAGDWPFVQAEQLAHMALRCCDRNRKKRPDLVSDVWRVLEPMKASSRNLSVLQLATRHQTPHYFLCPIFQEIMEDPHIAADGFTYEAEAIRGWLDSGHGTSPMTNVVLANQNLTPNRALRSAIQEWLQQHSRI